MVGSFVVESPANRNRKYSLFMRIIQARSPKLNMLQ